MKVTVCFGNVRVVVPCGNGELLVGDLINKAVIRYKKATGKSSDSWVIVHNLKSFSDGGILDPDDKLKDVADDREQLLAVYEEQGLPNISVTNGDGTSASSIGTSSPDIFHDGMGDSKTFRNDVEITCDTIPMGIMPLQVRRGSEPALNRLSPVPVVVSDPMKRWSAAVLGDQASENDLGEEPTKEGGMNNDETALFSRFSRESGRLSILGNTTETLRWVEAADRSLSRNLEKGQNELIKLEISSDTLNTENGISLKPDRSIVILKNEGGPLGIHVVPDYDETGRDVGLIIQGIEPGGRIDRDGRLQVQDRIVEINDQSLLNVNFQQAQEIFKDALQTNEIKLCLLKANGTEKHSGSTLLKNVPAKKAALAVTGRNTNPLLVSNTRKIGKKLQIQLNKGSEGLGFSITTRDNPAGGNCPIYIKNILPKGAAVQDGRLKPGDRLLEVNGIEMTGKSQTEAVTILRNTPLGGIVNLVVSRQETESPKLPREMMDVLSHDQPTCMHDNTKTDKNTDDAVVVPWKHRETLTFDIPLNDTGSAGLGVSVKGKTSTSTNGTVDLGIFVKSVITGGAASKDGRLHENDQLININGIALLGKSNTQAMDTLRRAIQQEGPNPDAITLTISRRIPSASRNDPSLAKNNSSNATSDNVPVTSVPSSIKSHTENSNRIVILQPQSTLNNVNNEKNSNNNNNNTSEHKIEDKDLGLDVPLRNPVIDRLTGQRSAMSSLRNESYYYATHVSWSPSPVSSTEDKSDHRKLKNTTSLTSPTVNLTLDDTIIIEDDDHNLSSTKHTLSLTSDEKVPVSQITDADGKTLPLNKKSDITNTSQMSLDEYGLTFARDGFGRQSISEKRHAQLDAKNTDTYQRNKKAREEKEKQKTEPTPITGSNLGNGDLSNLLIRANSADSLLSVSQSNRSSIDLTSKEVGSRLGMKKSSSLESLLTMVAEASNDGENFDRPTIKTIRVRGCNESFRAAVDRSYDVPGGNVTETMETLDEESESGSSGLGRGNSRQSSLSGEYITDDLHRFNKKPKKKGLLKGLGSVFKFGKNRKLTSDQLPRLTREDLERQKIEAEKQRARKAAQEEQERIQEQYRKLLHRQIEPQTNSSSVINNNHLAKDENFVNTKSSGMTNRHEKMIQLRAEYQRKHQESQGLYPGENFKEKTDQFIYAPIERQDPKRYSFQIFTPSTPIHRRANSHVHSQRFDTDVLHTRSHSYELYDESGSNKSNNHLDNTDCSKYSHYANYEEIQLHLQQQQQAMQSQYDRPSSNYYEYESIQSALKSMKISETNANSLPRPSHRKRSVQAVSSHPLDCTKSTASRKDKTKDHSKRDSSAIKSLAVRSQEPFFLSNKNESVSYHRHLNANSSKV